MEPIELLKTMFINLHITDMNIICCYSRQVCQYTNHHLSKKKMRSL